MRSNFTAIARSPHGSSITWQRSEASVTSTPRRRAASANTRIWYPVVAAKERRRFGPDVIFARRKYYVVNLNGPPGLPRCYRRRVKALVKSKREPGLWLEDIEVPQ